MTCFGLVGLGLRVSHLLVIAGHVRLLSESQGGAFGCLLLSGSSSSRLVTELPYRALRVVVVPVLAFLGRNRLS
jgi:hypothetical protein